MKKLESSLTNMLLVLVGFSLISAGLLAYVNHVTEAPIKIQAEASLAKGIQQVMAVPDLKVSSNDTVTQAVGGKTTTLIVHKAVGKDGNDLGAAVESTVTGFGGDLKVLVGFNPEGDILGYTILQTQETPGLGAKADKWFQKGQKGNVIGKNPQKGSLSVTKDGGSVDAITAATITSRAFLNAITQAYQAYTNNKGTGKTIKTEQHPS